MRRAGSMLGDRVSLRKVRLWNRLFYDGIWRRLLTAGDSDLNFGDNDVCGLVLGLLEPHRGRKIGSIAGRLLLRKCFTELHARRVESSAIASNVASLEMQDGMIEEARLLERVRVRDRVYDEVLFRLLRSEWEEQVANRGSSRRS